VMVGSTTGIVIGNETARPLRIGASNNSTPAYYFSGRIDELRITAGIARYTGTFPSPAAPFSDSVIEPSLTGTPPLDVAASARSQAWTYNQHGQVLTAVDAQDQTTTYAYHPATTADVTMGDLASVTNALGHVTQYSKYNRHGQLLESIDPNGVVTTHTYDLRQRRTSTTVGGQTTGYTYDPAGQLTRVTQPDGSWVGYEYDPAHRQTAVLDNRGNRIDYTLDNAGSRTGEAVRDSGGVLRRSLSRSIDAIGRVQQTTGREQVR
jgi:YD repeat-containing protein